MYGSCKEHGFYSENKACSRASDDWTGVNDWLRVCNTCPFLDHADYLPFFKQDLLFQNMGYDYCTLGHYARETGNHTQSTWT